MIDSEIQRYIQQEVKRQVHVILSGAAGTNSAVITETIKSLYPGMAEIPDRPIMHPFGIASRAPADTISVTARQGDHPGNVLTLGHRDKSRPTDLGDGESVLYSKGDFRVVARNGGLYVGKGTTYEEVVVGETLRTLLIGLIDAIVAHTHMGNLGYPTGKPLNASDFNTLKSSNLSNSKILAKNGGRF